MSAKILQEVEKRFMEQSRPGLPLVVSFDFVCCSLKLNLEKVT